MVSTVATKPTRIEPDWSRLLAAIEGGLVRVTDQQLQYVNARVDGATHFAAVEVLNLKGFAGWKLRGRLIDGADELSRLQAHPITEQVPA